MPKVLPNLQQKILTTAETHFSERGFEQADMRQIAADAGIAVGTIYLHYHNKEVLYHQVLAERWKKTAVTILTLSQNNQDPEITLQLILMELTKTISNQKDPSNTWSEIGMLHHHSAMSSDKEEQADPHDPISGVISDTLQKIAHKYSVEKPLWVYRQLGQLCFTAVADLCMRDQAKEPNINLIVEMLIPYLKM